jgi:hypothetical protein
MSKILCNMWWKKLLYIKSLGTDKTRFWNNLHQEAQDQKVGKPNNLIVLGAQNLLVLMLCRSFFYIWQRYWYQLVFVAYDAKHAELRRKSKEQNLMQYVMKEAVIYKILRYRQNRCHMNLFIYMYSKSRFISVFCRRIVKARKVDVRCAMYFVLLRYLLSFM